MVRNNDIVWKIGRLRRWQTNASKDHLIGVWMLICFIEQRRREGEEVKLKDYLFSKIGGNVLLFLFCSHSQMVRIRLSPHELKKSHFNLTFRQRGKFCWHKQWIAKVKVKQIQHGVKINCSLLQFLWCAPLLSGASTLCFLIPSFQRVQCPCKGGCRVIMVAATFVYRNDKWHF